MELGQWTVEVLEARGRDHALLQEQVSGPRARARLSSVVSE